MVIGLVGCWVGYGAGYWVGFWMVSCWVGWWLGWLTVVLAGCWVGWLVVVVELERGVEHAKQFHLSSVPATTSSRTDLLVQNS